MSTLNILCFPDPKLRQTAAPVAVVDDAIRSLVDDMFETMYAAPGIGLAAVQVNVLKQVIVIDTSEDKDQPQCFINPQIVESHGDEKMEEGCLSVPGIYDVVSRAKGITVRYLDRDGAEQELTVEGLLAVCIQHEMDHLDGKLFVDYLSEMKRNRIRKKMEKMRQHTM
jgi:peptide deformylase